MARVNIDQKAFTDARFLRLARLMGGADRDLALGRMVRVWNECIERETYDLPTWVIVEIFNDENAPVWVVEAGLAEVSNSENVRVRGTEGRIEWLAKKRATARKNGTYGGRPAEPMKNQHRLQDKTPPAPVIAPVIAPVSNTPLPPVAGGERPIESNGKHQSRKKTSEQSPGFVAFWAAYPRRENKPAAVRAFAKLAVDDTLLASMLAAIESQTRSGCLQPGATRDGRSTIPHPASWLNGRRWEDEQPAAASPTRTMADFIRDHSEGEK
jgi:hypothetical protein